MKNQSIPQNSKNQIPIFTQKIKKLFQTAEPYSYEEYLIYALQLALQSFKEKNFGVGAVIVFRAKNTEYIIGGRSQLFTKRNSLLHAERDALYKFEMLSQEPKNFEVFQKTQKITAKDIILKRTAPNSLTKAFIVTTLEPCAASYQEILIHNTFGIKISEIWIGTENPDSGSAHYLRKEKLPPIWKRMTEEQNVTLCTLWNSELHHLCQDLYTNSSYLEKTYYKNNTQAVKETITNLTKLTTTKSYGT